VRNNGGQILPPSIFILSYFPFPLPPPEGLPVVLGQLGLLLPELPPFGDFELI
jgi:hypothetical protein